MALPFPDSPKSNEQRRKTFIVALKQPAKLPDPRERGRGAVLKKMEEHIKRQVRDIENMIQRDNLQAEVDEIRPMRAVPVVVVTCTQKVADRIRELPGVDGVAEDVQFEPMQPDVPNKPGREDPYFRPGNDPPTFYC